MAMRKVTENEIWKGICSHSRENVSLEYLVQHVPKKYSTLVTKIHHVDTQLTDADLFSGQRYWRIQGYISIDDFVEWSNNTSDYITASIRMLNKDTIELWAFNLPFTLNRPRIKRFNNQ